MDEVIPVRRPIVYRPHCISWNVSEKQCLHWPNPTYMWYSMVCCTSSTHHRGLRPLEHAVIRSHDLATSVLYLPDVDNVIW